MNHRQKPEGAPDEAWDEFNELADDQFIGDGVDDWSIFWDFFFHGWCSREASDDERYDNRTVIEPGAVTYAEAPKQQRPTPRQRRAGVVPRKKKAPAKKKRNRSR